MSNLNIENKELNEKELGMKNILLASMPRMLMVVLTTRCNLECIMCTRKDRSEALTIPYEKISQIRALFPCLETIDWQGGEVFLVEYFKELFLEAKTFPNIDQSVITNGLLINKEWAEIFADSRVNLTFSIDAVTKHTYEYIRRGARFENLLENLETIRRVNEERHNTIQLHINTVVMRSNYKELGLFPDFCSRYGIKHLRFDFLRPDVAPEEDILIRQDIGAINYLKNELGHIEKKCKELNIWFEYTFKPYMLVMDRDTLCLGGQKINGTTIEQKLKCKLPWKKLYIDAAENGCAVRPDCLCKKNAGYIVDSTLQEIWNNEVMQTYRRKIKEGLMENWCSETCLSNAVDTYQLEGSH